MYMALLWVTLYQSGHNLYALLEQCWLRKQDQLKKSRQQ